MPKTPAQVFSSLVFGRAHHLAIIEWIAALDHDVPFTQAQIARALNVPSTSSIQTSFAALAKAGFIRELPDRRSEREQPYVRSGSHLWAFAVELARRATAFQASGGEVGVEVDEPIQPALFPT